MKFILTEMYGWKETGKRVIDEKGGRDREQSLFLPLYFSKSDSSHGNFQTRLALLCLYLQALV